MPRKCKPVAPFSVIMRMPPEAVARCWEMSLTAADIKVLKPGDPMRPACLWPRLPDKGRTRTIYYWLDETAGRIKPISTGYDLDDLDGALAWVLCFLSRKGEIAMMRLAPEEIPLDDLFDKYLEMVGNQHRLGQITDYTKKGYEDGIARLRACFGDATVMDIVEGGRERFYNSPAARGYAVASLQEDATTLKRAINWPLEAAGSAFRVSFWVGEKKPAGRVAVNPDEYLRIMHVLKTNQKFDGDFNVVMVRDEKTGEPRPWKARLASQRARVPFTRAFPLIIDTGTRSAVALLTGWFPAPEGEPPRPYLDPDSGLYVRNPLLEPETPEKRKGLCLLSPEFQATARAWMKEDLDNGVDHVVHDWRGDPVKHLDDGVWKNVLRDARVRRRKFYAAKHTAVTIAATEGVTLQQMGQRFNVRPETLANVYSLQDNPALQLDAAIAQGEKRAWFANHATMKARLARVEAGRKAKGGGGVPLPLAKPARPPKPPPGRRNPRKPPGALVGAPPRSRGSLAATLRTRGGVAAKPSKPRDGKTPAAD